MKTIFRETQFKKDFKKLISSGLRIKSRKDKFAIIVQLLFEDKTLPSEFKDHELKLNWQGFRECHIETDLLLIYHNSEECLSLVRIGTHSELFSK